ncbi:MAG: glycosyltransferase family 9 protein [Fusobacteriota bacterium]
MIIKAKEKLFKFLSTFFKENQKDKKVKIDKEKIKKVLLIRQDDRIGNLLFITPLITMVKRELSCELDIITGSKFSKIMENNPKIRSVHPYNKRTFLKKPWKFFKFINKMNKQKYDLIIDCKGGFSFNNAILTLAIKAKYKIGYENKMSHLYLDKTTGKYDNINEIHETQQLLKPFVDTFNKDDSDIPSMEYYFDSEKDVKQENVISIHIGGRGKKSLDLNFINKFIEKSDKKVWILYGPDEVNKVKKVKNYKNIKKILPESIDDLAKYIQKSKLFITPDTGPLHIASALNKDIVAIFYSNRYFRYGPKTTGRSLVIEAEGLNEADIIEKVENFEMEE